MGPAACCHGDLTVLPIAWTLDALVFLFGSSTSTSERPFLTAQITMVPILLIWVPFVPLPSGLASELFPTPASCH